MSEQNQSTVHSPGTQLVDVTAAAIIRNGQVLLARRPKGDTTWGKWELPGGKVEPGESPEVCLARELAEELGLSVTVGPLLAQAEHHYPHLSIRLLAYRIEAWSGAPVPHAHDEPAWVGRKEIAGCDLAPADIPILERLTDELSWVWPADPTRVEQNERRLRLGSDYLDQACQHWGG